MKCLRTCFPVSSCVCLGRDCVLAVGFDGDSSSLIMKHGLSQSIKMLFTRCLIMTVKYLVFRLVTLYGLRMVVTRPLGEHRCGSKSTKTSRGT